ncbi:unnamed protein product [Symbiodinium sp. CCMP2592]|nr:unnamed protein product [Symbiodinium sp. CCMP2592]
MLPHMLPKPNLERPTFHPNVDKEAVCSSTATSGRYIQVREKMPRPLHGDAMTEESIAEEWSSMVDAHLRESPRSAHLRLREIRQSAKLHQAWQQEVFREMQAKLDRYERDEPSPRLLKSREEEVPQPAQTQPPPFSQKQQREILEEFQRQQEENLRQQREMEAETLRQERLQARQNRRSSGSRPREAAKAAPSAPPTHPKKSKTSPLSRMMAHFRSKMSSLWRGRDAVTAFDGEGQKILEAQTERLLTEMKDTLAATHNEPMAVRRKVFRELQRKLHPDKNAHCREAAKIAFQQLMDQQSKYLNEVA